MHDSDPDGMARRKVRSKTQRHKPVAYADEDPSAFASLLGGLIEANIENNAAKRKDFDSLMAKVGFFVTDIDEGVTLEFDHGALVVHNGLKAKRDVTIRAEADTIMNLSNLTIGPFGLPVYYNEIGRDIVMKLVQRKLRIDGLLGNVATVNTVTRIFSVR